MGRTMRGVVAAVSAAVMGQASPGAAQTAAADARTQRYQITVMERVLENAVEHGASVTRDRLRAVLPADMLLSENAHARGFRLQGYGVFIDVLVPNLQGMLPWAFRTLDQTDLGLDSALRMLRAMVEQAGDADLRQALRRIEIQVAPFAANASDTPSPAGLATTASGTPQAGTPDRSSVDPILSNPEEAYRMEVMDALMDAMLDHSRGLDLATGERLTIGARRSETPRLDAGDAPARTIQISLEATDLQAFLQGQITRDEARRRMDVRVF